ncbi:hypothetical protein C8R45DRAFT_1135484 [Mycena sanguinolenta]|nr:hypothetical protein C8R45DRAFT_1135484 [Mycena sanguinolenta]
MSRGVVLLSGHIHRAGVPRGGVDPQGTARSAAKAGDWITHFPQLKASYQSAVVSDFVAPGAFDDAARGCDIIAHVASPNNPKIRHAQPPRLDEARASAAWCSRPPSPQCSRRRNWAPSPGPGKVYIERDWNSATYEEAKPSTDFSFAYGVSRTLAERAFWDFIETEKPAWVGAAILPCAVFDPPILPLGSLVDMNHSVALLWQVASRKFKNGLSLAPRHTFYVSARDAAFANVPAAEGEQSSDELVDILYRRFPALKDNLPPLNKGPDAVTEKDLDIQRMPFEQVVVDTIGGVMELDKKLKQAYMGDDDEGQAREKHTAITKAGIYLVLRIFQMSAEYMCAEEVSIEINSAAVDGEWNSGPSSSLLPSDSEQTIRRASEWTGRGIKIHRQDGRQIDARRYGETMHILKRQRFGSVARGLRRTLADSTFVPPESDPNAEENASEVETGGRPMSVKLKAEESKRKLRPVRLIRSRLPLPFISVFDTVYATLLSSVDAAHTLLLALEALYWPFPPLSRGGTHHLVKFALELHPHSERCKKEIYTLSKILG